MTTIKKIIHVNRNFTHQVTEIKTFFLGFLVSSKLQNAVLI